MELQQRFPLLARRFENSGVPGPISDSCMFILSKRHELLAASLLLVLGEATYKAHWEAARAECEANYASLPYDKAQSWCFWRVLTQMGFGFTQEEVIGQGTPMERLAFFEEVVEFIEEFQAGANPAEQRRHAQLMQAVAERMAPLCSSDVQLFDAEFAQQVAECQPSHAVSDSYIHSIEATAQQLQESIGALRRQVQPVGDERWQAAFGAQQRALERLIATAKELDQTYHIELCSWSEAAGRGADDLGVGRAAAHMVAAHGKMRRVQQELTKIREGYRAIASSAAPLQDLDQGWLRGLARDAAAKAAELRSEVVLLAGSAKGAGTWPAAAAGPRSWGGSSSAASL